MGELIPFTPEEETTPERFYWDGIIRAMVVLSCVSDEVDPLEELQRVRYVDGTGALEDLIYSIATIAIGGDEYPELDEIIPILEQHHLIAPGESIV